ncbi:copper chaperone PCu(A)C [Microbacterium bovistercoris]|uniref:Copper chaperone PCu(A)C n=1 Tax=Microbacterium bovistercoris TaxID=2293570 RepID=A0A371NQY0_9MICO|nr:copper chaperone PCu(A)C [Microbacterium bovistercoris]REJ04147.1 copper chaperone PCu(A)C [Microbacterium bovistercoris]
MKTSIRFSALLAASFLLLTGCAAAGTDEPAAGTAGQTVTIEDAWAKAADDGMTAVFGTLVNKGGDDTTVVSAQTEAAEMTELHETVQNDAGEMTMRPIEGGLPLAHDAKAVLEPGGDHIMLMGLTAPLKAGDEVTVTLTFSDDSTYEFTAPVKDYSGANENYEEGGE